MFSQSAPLYPHCRLLDAFPVFGARLHDYTIGLNASQRTGASCIAFWGNTHGDLDDVCATHCKHAQSNPWMNGGVFVPHSHLRGAGTSDYACLLCFWIIWKGGPGRHNGSELHMNGNTVSCYKSESVCTCMLEVPIMWKGVLKVTLKIPLFLHYGECTDHCHLLYCMCAIFEVLHHGSLVSNTAYTLSPLTLGGHNNHCWISLHSEQISSEREEMYLTDVLCLFLPTPINLCIFFIHR
jgi:hypothetical protein